MLSGPASPWGGCEGQLSLPPSCQLAPDPGTESRNWEGGLPACPLEIACPSLAAHPASGHRAPASQEGGAQGSVGGQKDLCGGPHILPEKARVSGQGCTQVWASSGQPREASRAGVFRVREQRRAGAAIVRGRRRRGHQGWGGRVDGRGDTGAQQGRAPDTLGSTLPTSLEGSCPGE